LEPIFCPFLNCPCIININEISKTEKEADHEKVPIHIGIECDFGHCLGRGRLCSNQERNWGSTPKVFQVDPDRVIMQMELFGVRVNDSAMVLSSEHQFTL
jgi:hypothetical protein